MSSYVIGIYKITNTINQKVYVGQSWDVWRRLKSHSAASEHEGQGHLYDSMRKHGLENFKFETLEDITFLENHFTEDMIQKVLNQLEEDWIFFYDSMDSEKGYNKCSGGSWGRPNKETREKMGESIRKFWDEHPEARLKKAEWIRSRPGLNTGKKRSEKARKQQSESIKKTYEGWTEEQWKALSDRTREVSLGRKASDETRHKLSEAAKKRPPQSPESIEKGAAKRRGRPLSEEDRRHKSEAALGKPKSESHRASIRIAAKKRFEDNPHPRKGAHCSQEQLDKQRATFWWNRLKKRLTPDQLFYLAISNEKPISE
jgi:group I intron endonuclease